MKTFTVLLELHCDCEFCEVERAGNNSRDAILGDSEKDCIKKAKEKGWGFHLFHPRTTAPGHF